MEIRHAIIFCVISLAICLFQTRAEMDLQEAIQTLMNAGIGIDLEESHIEEIRQHENLPAAYKRVLTSLYEEAETCDPSKDEYRRPDGVCNNLRRPLEGAVLHYQLRLLPNAYTDGISIPRMMGDNENYLSSARTVSVECFPPNEETRQFLDQTTTQMSMQWGQYIDHDIVFTEVMPGGGCCSDPRFKCVHPDSFTGGPCFPIPIPENDRFFKESCMNFKRSFSINLNNTHEQISGVTSFVDASTVYGSNQALEDSLRTHIGGLLKTTEKNMLPNQGPYKCRKDMTTESHCPHAGDVRVNVFPGLTSVHLMFVRLHNRMAAKLAKVNPQWEDERLFQETKKIISALHQKITYEEYLPHIIGDDAMNFFKLKPGMFQYEPNTNPGIINEFAVAAFRFGHSQINGVLKTSKDVPISHMYFQPWVAQSSEYSVKKIMKSQCKLKAQRTNEFFTTEVTDKLFLNVDAPGHSTDLGARNVQRGRDHGIQSYTKYLDLAINNFIKPAGLNYNDFKLPSCLTRNVYDSVEDIDLFVGGLHENPMPGALVGPTFAYIIGEQFRRLKFGDRFFFETTDPLVGFTPEQLSEVNKMSLAHVVCQTTDNRKSQRDVFHVANKGNPLVNCKDYEDMDFSAWKE